MIIPTNFPWIDDGAPTAADLDGIDIDEVMRSLTDQFAERMSERKVHDTDGYLAHPAGSSECLALGHHGWDEGDDLHPFGWDGTPLCFETRYEVACSWCEGECQQNTLPDLWSLPWVRHG